jgi:hypothetical protein
MGEEFSDTGQFPPVKFAGHIAGGYVAGDEEFP